MDYFPLFANLSGRRCLVVGGGDVALRKIRLLKEAGARVTVVAPELNPQVQAMSAAALVDYVPGVYSPMFLPGNVLVIAATNSPDVNAQVFKDAEQRAMLSNSVDDPDHSSFITPAIVDRSPLVIAISSGGSAPVLARMVREKLERELSDGYASLARLAARWRDRVKLRLVSLTARRRFWETFFSRHVEAAHTQHPQQLDDAMDHQLEAFARDSAASGEGEAWLVGAGPGDPSLLTLRAQQLLHRADVVLHDRLVPDAILAMARRDAEFIDVGKPLPGTGCASHVQDQTTALLIRLVSEGKRVCRLKGGDPFVFGRGGEEVTALQAEGLRYQIVPGITAASACAAYAGIPLTHRDHAQSVSLITGHGKDSQDTHDWRALARDRQTLALYMGVSRFGEISRKLQLHGRHGDTPVAVIERGTRPDQRVSVGTLRGLAELAKRERIEAPAMLIIGEVAAYAKTQQWFQPQSENTLQLKPVAVN